MTQHKNQQQNSEMSAKRQGIRRSQRATLISFDVNGLAASQRERLFRGLERFVNTGDSLEEYKALGKGWPGFWPLDLQGGTARLQQTGSLSLAWDDACHALFLVYRDTLRRVWISDPLALKTGAVNFLLGAWNEFRELARGAMVPLRGGGKAWSGEVRVFPRGLNEAWERVKFDYPGAFQASCAVVYADWKSGGFSYSPHYDFQRALYLLFRESWRARTCAKCSTYFVAQRPAQLYCSTACSGGVKRERTLKWWRDKGAKRRAAQAKIGRQRDGVNRSGRKVR